MVGFWQNYVKVCVTIIEWSSSKIHFICSSSRPLLHLVYYTPFHSYPIRIMNFVLYIHICIPFSKIKCCGGFCTCWTLSFFFFFRLQMKVTDKVSSDVTELETCDKEPSSAVFSFIYQSCLSFISFLFSWWKY